MHQRLRLVCFAGFIALACSCDPDKPKPVAMASVGSSDMRAIKPDGTAWTWGLGDCAVQSNTPSQIGGDKDWLSISAGFTHSMAIKTDGSLWARGAGDKGELGTGSYDRSCSPIPVRVGHESEWESVSASRDFTLALKKDGSLWAWGNIGPTKDTYKTPNTPQQVGDQKDWKQLSSGYDEGAFIIKKNGTLWGWGCGTRCGNPTPPTDNTAPVQVGTESNWASVSVGSSHVLALKADGSLWGWGEQRLGQLGTGVDLNAPDVLAPIEISAGTQWLAAAAGPDFTLAIKKDGTLWQWGDQSCGPKPPTPTQISADNDWVFVAAGNGNPPAVVAIKKDNSFWTWGCNNNGELGTGDTQPRTTPTKINF